MLTALSIIGTVIVGVICYKSGYAECDRSIKSMAYRRQMLNEFEKDHKSLGFAYSKMRDRCEEEYERGFQDGQKTVVINLNCKH